VSGTAAAGLRRTAGDPIIPAHRPVLDVPNRLITTSTITTRSRKMYTMHEALARERMSSYWRDAEQLRVARELAAARRWHRIEMRASAAGRHARAAGRRHARRAV
jgi:hypothetical protein